MPVKKIKENYKDNLKVRGDEAKTVRKVVAVIILLLLLIFVVGGISAYNYVQSALEPVDSESSEEIVINIPMGSSTSAIGNILEEDGIIKDSRIFRFYIKFKNEGNFQAGEYPFTKAFTLDEIITSLKEGKIIAPSLHTVTIKEGETVEDIAKVYSEALTFSEEEFLNLVSDEKYLNDLIAQYPNLLTNEILNEEILEPLEGYLFASTYDFDEQEPTIEKVLEIMLNQTSTVVDKYREQIKKIKINGESLSIHEAITFASLVEKEEPNADRRRTIAGVFYNRFEAGMRLQTDPTVTYAFDEKIDVVLNKHLETFSPYNTYMIDGLPVGPISNFNENALEATVDPEDTNYLFFLHDKNQDVYFSETYDEHLKLKQEHLN